MSGLATLCNAGPLINIQGKYYQIKGRTLRHIAEAESQILYLRGDLLFYLRSAINGLAEECQLQVCEKILAKIRHRWVGATQEDVYRFYSTLEGRAFSFWQAIRDNGVTYEEALSIYMEEADRDLSWERTIKNAIETATGESEISRLYRIRFTTTSTAAFRDEYLIARASLFSALAKEPFCFTPNQVSDMTFGQITMILSDKDSPNNDLASELDLRTRRQTMGIRAMINSYTKAYKLMAKNIVEGRSLMSGLKN